MILLSTYCNNAEISYYNLVYYKNVSWNTEVITLSVDRLPFFDMLVQLRKTHQEISHGLMLTDPDR